MVQNCYYWSKIVIIGPKLSLLVKIVQKRVQKIVTIVQKIVTIVQKIVTIVKKIVKIVQKWSKLSNMSCEVNIVKNNLMVKYGQKWQGCIFLNMSNCHLPIGWMGKRYDDIKKKREYKGKELQKREKNV